MLVEHLFLTEAKDKTSASQLIERFLSRYQLVNYEKIDILPEAHQPTSPAFWKRLEEGISRNRAFLEGILRLLAEEGFSRVLDLRDLPQGYLSKELHVAVHFLDGFFGVDSSFYNLVEDSHWVSRPLLKRLKEDPESFWLLEVKAYALSEAPLFERLKRPA